MLPSLPTVRHTSDFDRIVDAEPDHRVIADGFRFTEGPVWHPREHWLLFSDIPNSKLLRWAPSTGVDVFRAGTNMTNGNTLDRQGRLLCCEHATSRVTRTEADGRITVLVSHYQGKELNSPNDIVVRSDGRIFFTDPTYGRMDADDGVPRDCELPFRAVYRIDPDGSLVMLANDFDEPNGLCFSLDERRLFVNDTVQGTIRVFHVDGAGNLSGGAVWARPGNDATGLPDGMKIDGAGNVYCCGPGGIHVFDPDSKPLGILLVPEIVANFAWGDDDLKSLFVTATTTLHRVRTRVAGLPVF